MDNCKLTHFIKQFCLFLLIGLSLNCCGLFKKVQKQTKPIGNEIYDVMISRTMDINAYQLDSICVADTLERNIDEWISNSFIDYTTENIITKKMYIKQNSKKQQTIYVLTLIDDNNYNIVIRQEIDNE